MARIKEIAPYFRLQHTIATPYADAAKNWSGGSDGEGEKYTRLHHVVPGAVKNAGSGVEQGIAGTAKKTNQQSTGGSGGGQSYTVNAGNQPYIQQLNSLYEQIMNRKPFQYDLNGDLLYRQMADQYTQLGRQASADAMGQAAALTGGYGNSYATQVGNQANQQYLTMLNQNIPELWDRAYQAYLNEGDQLLQQYELAAAHPGYVQTLSPQTYAVSAPQTPSPAAGNDYNSLVSSVLSGMTGGLSIPENELREWVYKLGLNDKGK